MLSRSIISSLLKSSFNKETLVGIAQNRSAAHVEECAIIRDSFGVALQFAIILLSATFLIVKWKLEVPRRSTTVFSLDMTKQLLGIVVVQILNIAFSIDVDLVSANSEDQCSIFWSVLVADATIGLLMNLLFLWVSEVVFGYDSGVYGESSADGVDAKGGLAVVTTDGFWDWFRQLIVFITCISLSQFIMFAVMTMTISLWQKLGNLGTSWTHHPHQKLLFVVVLSPLALNTLMFVVQDSFIMHSPVHTQDSFIMQSPAHSPLEASPSGPAISRPS